MGRAGCPACAKRAGSDDPAAFVLHRGACCFAFLDERPYNSGHVVVCPNRHVGALEELTEVELLETMVVARRALRAVGQAFGTQAFNLGVNQGVAARTEEERGHLHVQVVPRSVTDTGYIFVLGHTRVLPQTVADAYAALRPGFG